MASETFAIFPFKSYKSMEPSSSVEVLRDFFVDAVRSFETAVLNKLAAINHPRRSFLKPERSVQLDGVHPYVFTDSFGMKFVGSEVVHVPPTDQLHYEVRSLARCRQLIGVGDGVDRRLVRRNEVGDWSLLSPLACLKEARPELGLERGALLVPLRETLDNMDVFAPSYDDALEPVLSQGTTCSNNNNFSSCVYISPSISNVGHCQMRSCMHYWLCLFLLIGIYFVFFLPRTVPPTKGRWSCGRTSRRPVLHPDSS